MERSGELLFPAINVNDAVTKSKFDNKYGCRHSLIDGINRATDTLIGGKVAVVCGFGDVGKGCAQSLAGQGARVIITEIDPICALQAAMEGFEVLTLDDVVELARHLRHRHRQPRRHHAADMARMKHQAIVGNIGHFDNEIDMAGLAASRHRTDQYQAPGRQVGVPRRPRRDRPVRGPAAQPGQCDRPSQLRDVELVHQPGHGPDRAVHQRRPPTRNQVYVLPKHLDEKVARLHLDALGVRLTELSAAGRLIGASLDGPYKPDSYRY